MIEEIETIKKSYNPFKMWGSWIGFIFVFIILLIYIIRPCGIATPNLVGSSDCVSFMDVDAGIIILPIFFSIVSFILGFLPGWGIHSLIRRL